MRDTVTHLTPSDFGRLHALEELCDDIIAPKIRAAQDAASRCVRQQDRNYLLGRSACLQGLLATLQRAKVLIATET